MNDDNDFVTETPADAITVDGAPIADSPVQTHSEVGHEAAAPSGVNPLLEDPATWILVAFIIFVTLFVRYLVPVVNKGLDSRAATIRDQLEQANRLRAEAQELLATYQREQEALIQQAETILEAAKRDAVALRANAAEELTQALARRTAQAQEKIAQAESQAVTAIRTRIIETATDRARSVLAERSRSLSDEQQVAGAFAAIETQMH